ncbi:hypothetical protein SAMN04489806_0837 [Paramicrobacterium humi]|uniref:VOC domain-containing protein n=1 Tax=Paramicrobacterium humi TaxID=640635 RepID=A0A1H4JS48_9MICO|nr:VOC family protein [Microbacterium humi]SEB49101.1 hypothetical protein SAMN04489806_0837 [Microbacterium humi]
MTASVSYWVLRVADVDKAADFYREVFDWSFSEKGSGGGYHVLGSNPQGGIGPLRSAHADNSLAFEPDDIDVAIERIRSRGGTAEEPGGSSEHGRWVECADDQGTRFALYAPVE